ncbi:hypothetical protein DS906_00270 [Ruegeria sp. A3M17]|nr:hypothetical protein DS906_00270 [Ruegeria sp. A3M17]
MSTHLLAAGFKILSEADSTLESHSWLKERAEAPKPDKRLLVTIQLLFGAVRGEMTKNQLRGFMNAGC